MCAFHFINRSGWIQSLGPPCAAAASPLRGAPRPFLGKPSGSESYGHFVASAWRQVCCSAVSGSEYSICSISVEVPLLAGKMFSAEELRHAEEALRQAGLSQFRVDGQKVFVPKAELTRYNAALVANKGLPAQFGAPVIASA